MSATATRQSAASILAGILDRPVETIPADASILNFPAWDSLAHVRFMLTLEELSGKPVNPGLITSLVDLQSIDLYLNQD